MSKVAFVCLVLSSSLLSLAAGDEAPRTEADLKREAAIAEFTRKMKDANYPVLFEQAAKEFNVPADVLKGVAFAETRWEQLTWPPGETASPETGMPRPYGIMSLWDNEHFGHSLIEAARLIGENPETLKLDPLQNMRGGAALLRKLYDQSPKPAGTTEADTESWRYAIRKYCGIPEPELAASHTLDVYVYMNQGYHQYGIEWNARPVNLEPIREETRRITAEEQAKRRGNAPSLAQNKGSLPESQLIDAPPAPASVEPSLGPDGLTNSALASSKQAAPTARRIWWFIVGALASLAALWWFSSKQSKVAK
jgi:hypothetical protein